MTEYTAICKRVGRWWEITVPDLDGGCMTQAQHFRDVEEAVTGLVMVMTGVRAADVKVSVRVPELPADPRARNELIVYRHGCPGCKALPGERCKSASGPAPMHVLRTNLAKREAAPGLCPLGCGDQLHIVNHNISHVKSGTFGCGS